MTDETTVVRNTKQRSAVDPPVPIDRSACRALAIPIEPSAVELEEQPRTRHADGRKAETRPPAYGDGQQRTEELGDQRSKVDAHVEDCESGVPPSIALFVERSDNGRDVGFGKAVSNGDERQSQKQDEDKGRGAVRVGLETI